MLIRWASVIRAGKDDKQFPVQQASYMGKTADTVMLFPYGMHANVNGDALGPLFIFGGNVEDRAMMPTSMNNRNQLAAGEVEFYCPLTGSRVTFRADGSIEIDGADINVTSSGNVNVTATGNLDATAATASITAATVTVNGNTVLAGNLTFSGTITTGVLSGATGVFISADAKTVTVTNGIITSII
jgi:hypothetical protein